jgi:hypothetical protein
MESWTKTGGVIRTIGRARTRIDRAAALSTDNPRDGIRVE